MRFSVIYIWILALILPAFASAQDMTSPMGDVYFNSEQTNAGTESICSLYESEFKKNILSKITATESQYKASAECLGGKSEDHSLCEKPIQQNLNDLREYAAALQQSECDRLNALSFEALKKYRVLIKKIYSEIANQWVKERNSINGGLSSACFGSNVQFEDHINNLKVIANDQTLCSGEITQWISYRDSALAKYLNGQTTSSSLSPEEIKALKEFQQLPWVVQLGDDPKFRQSMTDDQLKEALAKNFEKIRSGILDFHKKITDLSRAEGYKLYDFQNQFEVFKSGLHENKQAEAEDCKAKSGFASTCNGTQWSRCGSQVWGVAKEFLPVVHIVDAYQNISTVRSAYVTGVMTKEEASKAQAQNATSLTMGAVGLFSGAGHAVARIAAKAEVAAGRESVLAAEKLAAKATSKAKGLTKAALRDAQKANRQLSDTDRTQGIEGVLGRSLTDSEKKRLLEVHNTLCAKTDCTAAEIRDVKSLAEVKALLPDASPQQVKDLYRLGYLGKEADLSIADLGNDTRFATNQFFQNQQQAAHLYEKAESPADIKDAQNYFAASAKYWESRYNDSAARVNYLRAGHAPEYARTFTTPDSSGRRTLNSVSEAKEAIATLRREITSMEKTGYGDVNLGLTEGMSKREFIAGEDRFSRAYYDSYIKTRKEAIEKLQYWIDVSK